MSDIREAFEALRGLANTAAGARDYSEKDCERVQTIKAGLSANGGEAVAFTCHGNSAPAYSCNKPGDMSGTYYTHPTPPSVAVPEGWHNDAQVAIRNAQSDVFRGSREDYYETMMLLFARRILSLTAAPSSDHIADAGKVDGEREQVAATLSMRLSADSGYESEVECRVSANQWSAIQEIADKGLSATPSVPENEVKAMDSAPKDRAVLLYEGDDIYKGQWSEDCECWESLCGQPVFLMPEPDAWCEIPARLRTAGDEGYGA